MYYYTFINFRNIIFLDDSWRQPSRSPGEPIEGYWRYGIYDGCYKNTPVTRFSKDNVEIYYFPNIKRFGNAKINHLERNILEIDYTL